jgi:transcriptional regulator with XRE-family HTH domain
VDEPARKPQLVSDEYVDIEARYTQRAASLGRRLREARKQRGLTGTDLARAAGMSQPKLSKIETGRQVASPKDIEQLADALALAPEARAELLEDLELLRSSFTLWRESQPLGVVAEQRAVQAVELGAVHTIEVEPLIVPGLLQTPDYARAIFERVRFEHEDVEDAVSARLQRQTVLTSTEKRFEFVVLETCLHTHYGPPAVMEAQFRHLHLLSTWKNVDLVVVPMRTVLPVVPQHGFTIFDAQLVYADTIGGLIGIREAEEVHDFVAVADALRSVGAKGDEARRLIARAQEALG